MVAGFGVIAIMFRLERELEVQEKYGLAAESRLAWADWLIITSVVLALFVVVLLIGVPGATPNSRAFAAAACVAAALLQIGYVPSIFAHYGINLGKRVKTEDRKSGQPVEVWLVPAFAIIAIGLFVWVLCRNLVGGFDLALQPMPHCNPLLYGWKLNISWLGYLSLCLLGALVIRVAHSFVRALAIIRGDYPDATTENKPKNFITGFWWCLGGFTTYKEHSDLWIPTVLGFLEIAIYPILLSLQYYVVIGAWVGIKTAGSWMGYSKSRTSFNRFLLFTVISILLACLLSLFVERVKCA
jgi:hypothetical protein